MSKAGRRNTEKGKQNMCMTKREKALARFYGEIKEKIEDPAKGLEVMKKVIAWAKEHSEKTMTSKTGKEYKKSTPKYSVDTIKEMARKAYPELAAKKKSKEEEVLEYFEKMLAEKAEN